MDFNSLNQGDWQNFIYLTLILVMLVSGLISRRMPFPKVVKYLAIWSAIGILAISLYAYRFEFSDFKNRVMGEIKPSSIQITDAGEMIINLAQDGHFYMDVEVNESPMRFMIDTGASDIVISLAEARRIGIKTEKLNFNKSYQTANGISWGASVVLKTMKVGNMVFYDIPASVNSAEMGTPLLGMSFLRRFKKYEFYRDKLILSM
ncbi:MAG: TIGR02281 family clan AA aspartic protease [Pseudomonadota bacterium]